MVCNTRSKVLKHASECSIRLFAVCLAILSRNAIAQEIEPHSVSFGTISLPVSSIESIGANTLKITVFGEPFLATKEVAGRIVVDRYLEHFSVAPDRTVSMMPSIVDEAAERRDSSLIRKILVVAIERDAPAEFVDSLFWKRLLQIPLVREELSAVVAGRAVLAPKKKCTIVEAIRSFEADVPLEVIPSDAEVVECIPDLQQGLAEVFSNRITLAEVKSKYALYKATFRESDYVASTVDRYVRIIEALEEGLYDGEWVVFQNALDLVLVQPVEDVSTLRPKAAIFFINRSISNNKPMAALQALPFVTERFRTPTVHADIVSAIRALPLRDVSIFRGDALVKAFQRLVSKDEEVRYELTRGMLRVVAEVKAREELLLCNDVARILAREQLVSSAGQREVAIALTQRVLKIGERVDARLIKEVWGGALPLGANVRLNLFQWGLWQFRWFFFALCSGLAAWFWRQRVVHRSKLENKNDQNSAGFDTVKEARDTMISDELVTSLAFFGLEPGATEKEIKNAYRMAVKQYHPDSGQFRDDGNEHFIKITSEYERLVKLLNIRAQ